MKTWIILALLFAVCAVFLSAGRTEESKDGFEEQALEYIHGAVADNGQSENDVDSLSKTPSDDEDETALVKRMPWRRRRGRHFWKKVHKVLKKVCRLIKNSRRKIIRWTCRLINGDEERLPKRLSSDEDGFISPEEVAELMKKGWKKEEEGANDNP